MYSEKRIIPSKHSSFQLPRVPLQLIPVRIHTPKEVAPAMDIQHDPLPRIVPALPHLEMRPHLNPLGAHLVPRPTPLPPRLPSHTLNTMAPQLRLYGLRAGREVRLRDRDQVDLDPQGVRHPLRGEALDVLDRVVRGVQQELLD